MSVSVTFAAARPAALERLRALRAPHPELAFLAVLAAVDQLGRHALRPPGTLGRAPGAGGVTG